VYIAVLIFDECTSFLTRRRMDEIFDECTSFLTRRRMDEIFDEKAAIKREESGACSDYPEREQTRPKVKTSFYFWILWYMRDLGTISSFSAPKLMRSPLSIPVMLR